MRVDVLSIFPAYLDALDLSLPGKARANGLLDLRVHDLWGRQVAVLAHGVLEPGRYRFALDATGWASGCYFARARLGGEEQVQRLLLVK